MRNASHPKKFNSNDSGDESPSCATYSVDRSEDNPCVNSNDDHIYMEVGEKVFKSRNVTGGSGGSTAGLGGLEGEDEEEDDYVIMNPGDNSHVYTPLAFHTRNNSTG
jgi:hypothetical protein